jgi:hypothetical protein
VDEQQPPGSDEAKGLQALKQELEARLARGEDIIRQEREKDNMARVAALERHWMDLLREYEQVCEKLEEVGE